MVYAAQGDPRRSMALLWSDRERAAGTPGPRPALTVPEIVTAAIAVADQGGLPALSMRAVGERLSRTAMALYTYIPGKAELLDLMHDQAHTELPTEYDVTAGWRPALTHWADDFRDLHLRHPWLLQISQARPVLGPGEFTMLETLTRVLHQTTLAPAALRPVVGLLLDVVRGAARTVAEARSAAAGTGVSDVDWWSDRSGELVSLAPDLATRFPMVVWLNADPVVGDDSAPWAEQQVRANFAVALDLVLDGIEAAIAS